MTTKQLAELDARDHQLEQRMAELRDEFAVVQHEAVPRLRSSAQCALRFGLGLLLVPERFRTLHLLVESVVYDGATGELELSFYPLGLDSLAAEATMIG
jgi:hypothetical protein